MSTNKRIYIYYPTNINYEERLRDYLNGYFMDYCKKHSKTRERYEKNKENPSSTIEKFISYNNGQYIHIIKIFLSGLYQKKYLDNPDKEVKYIPLYARILQSWMSDRYYKLLIKFMLHERFIEQDKDLLYWTETSQKDGSRSQAYRISPNLYDSDKYNWERKRLTISKTLYDNLKSKKAGRHVSDQPDFVKKIEKHIENWYLDLDLIPQNIQLQYVDKILDVRDDNYFKYKTNRVHYPELYMKKELRKYLRYEGSDIDDFILLETANCFQYALGCYLFEKKRNKVSDVQLEQINEFCKTINALDPSTKQEVIKLFSTFLKPILNKDRLSGFKFITTYVEITDIVDGLQVEGEIMDLFSHNEREFKEYLLWILISTSGIAYDVMAVKMNKTRKEFKDAFRAIPNLEISTAKTSANKTLRFFNKYFPYVHDYIKDIKIGDNSNFFKKMSRVELELISKGVKQTLIDDDIPCLGINDGIIIPDNDDKYHYQKKVEEISKDKWDLIAPTKFETLPSL